MAIKNKISKNTKVDSGKVSLLDQLDEQQQALIEAKLGHKQGELINPRILVNTRKRIARLKTTIRLNQLADKENK